MRRANPQPRYTDVSIYAVEILGRAFVKIGFTSDPLEQRIAALQTGCPFRIKEILCVAGTIQQEKALHSALRVGFGRVRIPMPPNEWYPGTNGFFVNFLSRLSLGANQGLAFCDEYNPSVKQPGHEGKFEPNIRWPTRAKFAP